MNNCIFKNLLEKNRKYFKKTGRELFINILSINFSFIQLRVKLTKISCFSTIFKYVTSASAYSQSENFTCSRKRKFRSLIFALLFININPLLTFSVQLEQLSKGILSFHTDSVIRSLIKTIWIKGP